MDTYTLFSLFLLLPDIGAMSARKVGDDIELSCDNQNNRPNCLWQRKTKNTKFRDLQDQSKFINKHTIKMRITNFSKQDVGEYRCSCFAERRQLTTFSPVIDIRTYSKGESFTLKCPSGGDRFEWNLTYFKELGGHNNAFEGLHEYSLKIRNVHQAYNGAYRCDVYYHRKWHSTDVIILIIQDDIDGNWSEWSSYSTCQVSCGNGHKTRTRTCTDPEPSGNGQNCFGISIETEECSLHACPEWTSWTGSSECSTACGYGQITKTRVCIYQNKEVNNNMCGTSSIKTMDCFISPCEVISGGNQKISCNYQHSVRWGRLRTSDKNFIPLESNNPKYEGLNQREITIKNIDSFDNGTYKCSQHDNYWQYGKQIEIIVKGKPQISVPQQTYSIYIGGTITLRCSSDGTNPPLEKLWWTSNNGKEARELQGKYQNGNTNNHDLTILRITAEDEGTYTCHGENSMGVSSSTTNIIIGYKPSIKIEESYIARKNENVTLQCEVVKGDHVQISWIRVENNRLTTIKKTSSTTTLMIPNVKTTKGGNYTCKAMNGFGEHEATTTLKVLDASINKTSYKGDANKSLKLDCTINDAKDVRWFLNGSLINIENHRKYHGGNIKEASLTVYNLSRDDRGSYVCQAVYDSVEYNSKPIDLSVRDKPYVIETLEFLQTEIGSIITLPCSFKSDPKPNQVYWKKLNKTIQVDWKKFNGSQPDIPDLVISDTRETDSGQYVCFVTNRLGTASGNPIQLYVNDHQAKGRSAGGSEIAIVVIIFVVIFIIAIVIFLKRKQIKQRLDGSKQTDRVPNNDLTLNYNQAGNSQVDNGSSISTSIPHEQAESMKHETYYNVSDLTSVKLDDFKMYIERKQINDGLGKEYTMLPKGDQYPTSEAQRKENMPKNRFKTTFPYDHSRVILDASSGAQSDYINASFVDGFKTERCYIASQGPLKNTIYDHWRMVWQNNITKIVMLTNMVEAGKPKCDMYWPTGGQPMTVGILTLTLASENERAAYVTREIKVENRKTLEKRVVMQYHFTAWPDHGTADPLYLVLFHRHVTADQIKENTCPLLVHCSAGIGRTGTFIALDALLKEGRETGYIDVFKFIKKMRFYRTNMVQTKDQYVCLHNALLEAFAMRNTLIETTDFGKIWQAIHSDRSPINQQKLHEEFKALDRSKQTLSHSLIFNENKSSKNHIEYMAAMSTANKNKNRNIAVLPTDKTRLFLVSFGKGRTDYINAVQVPSYTKLVGYITTQLPLHDTKVDFWTMIKDHDISTIVLILNDAKEADMVYTQTAEAVTIGPFDIKVLRRQVHENNITTSRLSVSIKNEKPREITVLQAISQNIPDSKILCTLVNLSSTRISMSDQPIAVVSCDGAKNCGLFCAFANAVSSIQIDGSVDIFHLVRLLQLRRQEFFSNFEEYKRCYEALHIYLETTNVYANF